MARHNDARVGRWTAKDPIRFEGRDTSHYGFGFGDPINHIDPTGTTPLLSTDGGAGWALEVIESVQVWDKVIKNAVDLYEADMFDNWPDRDKFFHCRFNCQVHRMDSKSACSKAWILDIAREVTAPSAIDPAIDDMAANHLGHAVHPTMSCDEGCGLVFFPAEQ